METLKQRVENRLLHINKTKVDLASALGESGQNINNWLKRGSIPYPKRDRVAEFLECDTEWLITGKMNDQKVTDNQEVDMNKVHTEIQELLPRLNSDEAETLRKLIKNIIERKELMGRLS